MIITFPLSFFPPSQKFYYPQPRPGILNQTSFSATSSTYLSGAGKFPQVPSVTILIPLRWQSWVPCRCSCVIPHPFLPGFLKFDCVTILANEVRRSRSVSPPLSRRYHECPPLSYCDPSPLPYEQIFPFPITPSIPALSVPDTVLLPCAAAFNSPIRHSLGLSRFEHLRIFLPVCWPIWDRGLIFLASSPAYRSFPTHEL